VAVVVGGWLYVQQRDIGKRRALDGRETALIAGFEEHVIAPRPAAGVVVETGPLVALRGTSGPETVVSLPEDLETTALPPQDPLAAAAGPAGVIGGSVALFSREPPSAAAKPDLQSATVSPPATLGSPTSPATEPPAAPLQKRPTGSVTPLPPRRPLQIRIARPPRAVPQPALLRRREAL
jgi:hypothetical protein